MLKIFAFSDTNEADHILTTTGNYRIHHSVQEQLEVNFLLFVTQKKHNIEYRVHCLRKQLDVGKFCF
jgi:hypothetical protein